MAGGGGGGWSSVLTGLADLVLVDGCAGCGRDGPARRYGVCADCRHRLARLRPHPTRPEPPPPGLPPCAAYGEYTGVLRELVLAYKDRGWYRLARPLGRLLAEVVVALLVEQGVGPDRPVLLVPVPDTPAAARARHGDHLWRLARPAAARLRSAGLPVALARPLRARPRPDSTGLDQADRASAARASLRLRRWRVAGVRHWLATAPRPAVLLLDDVVTTGATLAAAAHELAGAGVPVTGAAVLAATRRTWAVAEHPTG